MGYLVLEINLCHSFCLHLNMFWKWIEMKVEKKWEWDKCYIRRWLTGSLWLFQTIKFTTHLPFHSFFLLQIGKTHSQCWETRLLEIPGGVFHSRVSPPLNGDLKRDQEYHHLDWRNLQKPLGKVKIKFILFLKSWTVCTILHRYEFLNELWFCFCNLTFI